MGFKGVVENDVEGSLAYKNQATEQRIATLMNRVNTLETIVNNLTTTSFTINQLLNNLSAEKASNTAVQAVAEQTTENTDEIDALDLRLDTAEAMINIHQTFKESVLNVADFGEGVSFGEEGTEEAIVKLGSGWVLKIGDTALTEQNLIDLLALLES